MIDPTKKEKKRKGKGPSPIVGVRLGLGLLLTVGLTWFLAGSLRIVPRAWHEGRIAPYTVFAPHSLVFQEQDRQVEIQKGELVVSRGEKLTSNHIARLSAFDRLSQPATKKFQWLGAFLLSILFIGVISVYLKRYETKVWESPRQLTLILLIVTLVLSLARLILESPLDKAWIPVAMVPMLLGMLLNPRLAIVLGVLTSGWVGLMVQADLPLLAGWVTGCFVGAYAVSGIRRRMHFFRAGLVTGLAQGLMIFGGCLLTHYPMEEAVVGSLAGLLSGIIFSGVITFCLLPLCESSFGMVTDVSLLEMSDLNHPLLKELSVKAPGTYHHSLIVANLAEAACEAIGANPLLARVGCYFHDIGKMLHPEYFVENQPPETSMHDALSPAMSSLVILNHVKEGIKLARKHRINEAIIDFIPGHHGTGLIYYFYRRALEQVEDEALLKEERFRYPGPKPHAKETAVALLADSAEAATRALPEKTPAKLQEAVQRIINNKFIDGQLNDCDLTLKDLHRISEAFLRILAGMYHSRIEYPRPPGEELDAASAAG